MIYLCPAPAWPYLDSHVDAYRESQRLAMIQRRNRACLADYERRQGSRRHAR